MTPSTPLPPLDRFLALLAASLPSSQSASPAGASAGGPAFIRLTLSRNTGLVPDTRDLKRLELRLVVLKGQPAVSVTYRHERRDETRNYPPDQALALVRDALAGQFLAADLRCVGQDHSLRIDRKGVAHLVSKKAPEGPGASGDSPTAAVAGTSGGRAVNLAHDRPRQRQVAADAPWLRLLGVSDAAGQVIPRMQDKYRQIDRFVAVIQDLVAELPARTWPAPDASDGPALRVVDMGCGKAYLTFALYDSLRSRFRLQVTGVEQRPELVAACNGHALAAGFAPQLSFQEGSIADWAPAAWASSAGTARPAPGPDTQAERARRRLAGKEAADASSGVCHSAHVPQDAQSARLPAEGWPEPDEQQRSEVADAACEDAPGPDILIALHACNTATDDALLAAIRGQARVVVCSPCCHKQVRQDMAAPGIIKTIARHGILEERLAELLTDSIRALVLEAWGYRVKVFEFISPEHTGKNLMITGVRTNPEQRRWPLAAKLDQARELAAHFGVARHYLLERLDQLPAIPPEPAA